jgi:hypothetical protein
MSREFFAYRIQARFKANQQNRSWSFEVVCQFWVMFYYNMSDVKFYIHLQPRIKGIHKITLIMNSARKQAKHIVTRIYLVFLAKLLKNQFKKSNSSILESFQYLNEPMSIGILDVNQSYLIESGWIESKVNNKSFFKGEHWPRITFPAIDFLERFSLKTLNVLEFGAGASTLYFAARSSKVVSYEFDAKYFESLQFVNSYFVNTEILNLDPSEIQKRYQNDPKLISDVDDRMMECVAEDSRLFGIDASLFGFAEIYNEVTSALVESNLVFIDGGPRNSALFLTAKFAKTDTIVIVDNSDQKYLATGLEALKAAGFFEIPFAGLSPLNPYKSQTSFFVKSLDAFSHLEKQ